MSAVLFITDFTDQNDIRGLSQHCPDNCLEGHPNVCSYFTLVHTWEVIFDRIFGCDDLPVWPIQLIQHGVQGGRFTRTRRPGNQEDTVRPADQTVEFSIVFLVKTEVADRNLDVIFVQ